MIFQNMTSQTPCRVGFSAVLLLSAGFMVACGGGSSSHQNNTIVSSGSNVQPIVVNAGPANEYTNGAFTSVTVCVPSTTTCQTIDGVLVDTASYGLRLLSSNGGGELTLSLTQQTSGGNPVGECALFGSGFTWGPVANADVTISGESASNVPVQVIDPTFAAIPSSCANNGFGVPGENTLNDLGSNGILGIGPFTQDCGTACATSGPQNPGVYFDCASTTCTVTTESLTAQVQNPVPFFPTDNNGVIVELPSATAATTTLSGSLVFGIGTQSNNGLNGATVFPINSSGFFTTSFDSVSYPAFVDSGSNGLYFLSSGTANIATCPSPDEVFYCPSSQDNLSATTSSGSASESVSFSIANADQMFNDNPADDVFPMLGGPLSGQFDWGLPFFYGRNVFTAINGASTSGGNGPYWAY
jgi:Protein of unknown function (DUF3443)